MASAEEQLNTPEETQQQQQQAGGEQQQQQQKQGGGGAFGKLFVGQVPAVCTEEMLMPLFAPYGNIVEIKVMRDGAQRSKGCAWVRYENQGMAQAAIDALHEKHTIPPQVNTLQVRYAHSSREGGAGGAGGGGQQRQGGGGGGQRRQGGGGNRNRDNAQAAGGQGEVPPSYGVVQNNPYAMWQNPVGAGSFGSGNGSFGYQMNWPQYSYGNQGQPRMQTSPPGTSVFIGNLPPTVDNESLRAFVSTHVNPQNITGVSIHRDRRFGFAQFDTAESAHAAASILNGQELQDRKVRCEVTQNEAKKSQFRTQQQQQQQWQGQQGQQQGGY